MKNRIFELMKPKAASLGFTKDELLSVCENLAGRLSEKEDATDDDINAQIDAVLPFLQISQSAANRIVQQSKKKPIEKKVEKPAEEEEKPAEEEEVPKWAQKLMDDNKSLREKLEGMESAKTHETFMKSVSESLKDVNPAFYSMALEGRKFNSQEDADSFVEGVKTSYKTFSEKMNLSQLDKLTPPKGGNPNPNEPSAEVKARVEARKEADKTVQLPIKGLE